MSIFNDYMSMHELECRVDLHDALDRIRSTHSTFCNDGTEMREVLYRRFWLNQTLKSIGDDLGKTPERIRQIEARALRMLRWDIIRKAEND